MEVHSFNPSAWETEGGLSLWILQEPRLDLDHNSFFALSSESRVIKCVFDSPQEKWYIR